MFWKREVGNEGEDIALQFLRKNGVKIFEHSYRVKAGEVDIIAKDRQTYCFIEVKSRSSNKFGTALEAVDYKKRMRMTRAALWYLQAHHLTMSPCRFDVVAIQYDGTEEPRIEWIRNAFEAEGNYQW